jgi:hypothetical protein
VSDPKLRALAKAALETGRARRERRSALLGELRQALTRRDLTDALRVSAALDELEGASGDASDSHTSRLF